MKEDDVMKFNENSVFYKVTTITSQFIALNLLYLLCCLPLVTIGVATTALLDVTLRYADGERGYLIKDFFSSLKHNWKQSTQVFLLLSLPFLLLSFSSIFWFSFKTILTTIAGLTTMTLASILVIALIIATALISHYENTTKQTLQNALLLVVAHPLKAICLFLIPVTICCLAILMPTLKIIFVAVGFSLSAYISAFLLLSIFTYHK